MNVPRSQIANALLALLEGVNANIAPGGPQFPAGSITRQGRMWSSTPPASQPALYIVHPEEEGSQNYAYGEAKWSMWFVLIVFYKADQSMGAVSDDYINLILDGIDKTLQAGPQGERQTLGDIVTHCYIQGRVQIATPETDSQQMFAIVPVKVDTGI